MTATEFKSKKSYSAPIYIHVFSRLWQTKSDYASGKLTCVPFRKYRIVILHSLCSSYSSDSFFLLWWFLYPFFAAYLLSGGVFRLFFRIKVLWTPPSSSKCPRKWLFMLFLTKCFWVWDHQLYVRFNKLLTVWEFFLPGKHQIYFIDKSVGNF